MYFGVMRHWSTRKNASLSKPGSMCVLEILNNLGAALFGFHKDFEIRFQH